MFLLAAPARSYPALVPEPTPAPTSAPVDLAPLHLPIAFLAFLAVFSLSRCVLPARHLMLTGKYGAPGSNGRGKRAKTETWLSFRITWQAPPAPDPAPSQADAKPQLAPGRGARPRTPHASSLPSAHSGTRQTLPPPGPAPSQADAKPQMAPGPGARPRPPLPPAFKSHPPVSMAKIIMVRHVRIVLFFVPSLFLFFSPPSAARPFILRLPPPPPSRVSRLSIVLHSFLSCLTHPPVPPRTHVSLPLPSSLPPLPLPTSFSAVAPATDVPPRPLHPRHVTVSNYPIFHYISFSAHCPPTTHNLSHIPPVSLSSYRLLITPRPRHLLIPRRSPLPPSSHLVPYPSPLVLSPPTFTPSPLHSTLPPVPFPPSFTIPSPPLLLFSP
ncbi:hypothetical protein B0H11DRAFT_345656 [Mycena galericulata]|nr:hypothetical protein B0H11DRAFT_345656 [Mycena galericulata]